MLLPEKIIYQSRHSLEDELFAKGWNACIDNISQSNNQNHGYWIGKPIAGYATVRCSCCKSIFQENTGRWNYCPDCGKPMDGKKVK